MGCINRRDNKQVRNADKQIILRTWASNLSFKLIESAGFITKTIFLKFEAYFSWIQHGSSIYPKRQKKLGNYILLRDKEDYFDF